MGIHFSAKVYYSISLDKGSGLAKNDGSVLCMNTIMCMESEEFLQIHLFLFAGTFCWIWTITKTEVDCANS